MKQRPSEKLKIDPIIVVPFFFSENDITKKNQKQSKQKTAYVFLIYLL